MRKVLDSVALKYMLSDFKRLQMAGRKGLFFREQPVHNAAQELKVSLCALLKINPSIGGEGRYPASFLVLLKVLHELIKNAYDADAIEMSFEFNRASGDVVITDDGDGFSSGSFPVDVGEKSINYSDVAQNCCRIESQKSSDITKLGGAGAGLSLLEHMMQQVGGSLEISNVGGGRSGAKLMLRSQQTRGCGEIDSIFAGAMKALDRASSGRAVGGSFRLTPLVSNSLPHSRTPEQQRSSQRMLAELDDLPTVPVVDRAEVEDSEVSCCRIS